MKDNITTLKDWFDELNRTEQEKVLKFLYGERLVSTRTYVGPPPLGWATKGLYCGDAPSASTASACPTCGRPY
jgi:hypothetical protein